MCGRVHLSDDFSQLKIVFSIPDEAPAVNFPPNWNGAPTQSLPMVHSHPETAKRSLTLARFGLIPHWYRGELKEFRLATINAMAETITEKQMYRDCFRKKRCLIPVNSFYEWQAVPGQRQKQPYAIALVDGPVMALAGIWSVWQSPQAEITRSFSIVTTRPNRLMAEIHDRMPVILAPSDWPAWLGEIPAGEEQLKALLAPYPAERMRAWPVSTRVGSTKDNDPGLIDEIVA